ncbi:hypothetical protein CLF_112718 [Clonorchis sinensis]|uniref:Uncharacterized protein n=1 Tax=Clonorchis sinensis TaxID=79923 RepID=G7YWV6_CLOSI|nr:hypothetical protein CLF_112718 [Clonorchis sinensis]
MADVVNGKPRRGAYESCELLASMQKVQFNDRKSRESTRNGCPARFHVRRYNDYLMVTPYHLEYKHSRSKFIFDRRPINRRLTNDQLKERSTLLKYGAPSSEIRLYVADHFGNVLSIQDGYNYRVECRQPLLMTNNRLKNANERLNRCLHHADSVEHAIQKVPQHSEWLMREYEMHITYYCDRREIYEGGSYVLRVVPGGRRMPPIKSSGTLKRARQILYNIRQMTSRTTIPNEGGVLRRQTTSPVVSVASQLTLLIADVREVDCHIIVIAAPTSLDHCVGKFFRHLVNAYGYDYEGPSLAVGLD